PLPFALAVPASVLDAERVDGRGLLSFDDEVLPDLAVLVAALHDRPGDHEDRRRPLVLDDERVDAAAAARLAHLGQSLGERVVERCPAESTGPVGRRPHARRETVTNRI